jgi:L-alanine-DL-glutamate epimerase-like enolase superfamily enzyme
VTTEQLVSDRITRIEAIPVALPLRREWLWRGLGEPLGRWVIVRVHAESGLIGLGEATPLADWGGDHGRYYGETPATVIHLVHDVFEPLLRSLDPFDIQLAIDRMDVAVRGHFYAKAAIEMALHDLRGRIAGEPLYRLLGGRAHPGVPVAHMIGIMPTDEATDEAQAAIAEGARALQVKGTGEPDRDIELIRRLRTTLGEGIVLRLDANEGYRDTKLAIRTVQRLGDAGVDFVEQPTQGIERMAQVCAAVDVPIVADESCWQPEDAAQIGARRAADAISIYLAKSGGIARAQRVAAVADAFGLPCDVNGSLESGVGNAANLHFALATPAVRLACVIPVSAPAGTGPATVGRYYADDLVTRAFEFADGALLPLDGPGLGIELDEEKLDAYRLG